MTRKFLISAFSFVVFSCSTFCSYANADLTMVDCFDVESAPVGDLGGGSVNTQNGIAWMSMANAGVTNFTDVVNISANGATQTGLTKALDNAGGDTRKMASGSLEGYTGFDTSDATLCFYLSPDQLNRRDQAVFESGGTNGMGLMLDGANLCAAVQQNGAAGSERGGSACIDITSLYGAAPNFSDFLKITMEIDLTNQQINLMAENLGTGLSSSSSGQFMNGTVTDWTGANGAGLFQLNGGTFGSAGIMNGLRTGGNYQNFNGQLASMKFYEGIETVPEPASAAILSVVLGIACLRRRNRN